MRPVSMAGVFLVLSLSCAGSSLAATRYVNVSNATPAAPYTNWGMAATAIQPAIDEAATGDEILVAPGTYSLAGSSVNIPAEKTLALRSTQSRAAIIDAQGLSPGVWILGTNSVLEGFTVRNGLNGSRGGGIVIGRICTVRDCLVTSNRAFGGGGILVYGEATHTRVEACTISDNVVEEKGGGVALYNNSYGCLDRCVIRDNVASNDAGGVWIQMGGTISNCWITGNRALQHNGGGIQLEYDGTTNPAVVVNSVIAGNSAARYGGGVYSDGPAGTLSSIVNCTIVSNSAGMNGGGAFAYTTRFVNDILYFNSAPTNANLNAHDTEHSCVISNCCTTSNYFWPSITNAPAFVNAAAGDFRLATASFCIDAGTTNGAPRSDIDGHPRPRIGVPVLLGSAATNCDMGAYEYGFHFNSIAAVSSNAVRLQWDVQDVGRYRLDAATNAAADPRHPVWNSVMTHTQAVIIGAGQYAVYTTTVTNPAPPMPTHAIFRLSVDRATAGKRRMK